MRYSAVRTVFAASFPFGMAAVVIWAALVTDLADGSRAETHIGDVSGMSAILLLSLITGLASMVVIELAKRLFWLRSAYQRTHVLHWFDNRARSADSVNPATGLAATDSLHYLLTASEVYQPKLAPARRDRRRRWISTRELYNLPIEQLCAQISLASEDALESPELHSAFLSALAGDQGTVHKWHDDLSPTEDGHDRVSKTQILIAQRVRAGIDDLQVTVGQRWRQYVRATAIWLSGLVGLIVSANNTSGVSLISIAAALVIGGFLAWLARDITAAIERLRG